MLMDKAKEGWVGASFTMMMMLFLFLHPFLSGEMDFQYGKEQEE